VAQGEVDVLFEHLESVLTRIGHLREGKDK
jgi:hypothetical protein